MITLRSRNYDDANYDSCGNTTYAVIEIDNITIPLCEECVNSLIKDLDNYKSTVFCRDCKHWICNRYGYSYDGTCKLKAIKNGQDISEDSESVGYIYGTSHYETCDNAERK